MTAGGGAAVYLALVHHPIRDRQGEEITTAVTNLDVHDIARTCRTYGLRGYFVVTPIEAQRQLVEHILDHWRTGAGATRVPERGEALRLVRLVASLGDAIAGIADEAGAAPRVLATAAKRWEGATAVDWADEARGLRASAVPRLLVFGTGHGLTERTLVDADGLLPPIRSAADYNHLSVRAAVSIVLERLIAEDVL